tara:strand:- start:70 stop:738 length:669 start_codon:yes stop_codon:yes gene_type:complete
MPSYFRQVPNFEYVNRLPDSKNSSEYIEVKNIFKRGKLKKDVFNNLMYFTQYKIIGDDRPDNVAFQVYNDETLDWLVLLSNNIVNIQTEWPLEQQSFLNYLLNKYGSQANLLQPHHYETVETKNTKGSVIVKKGLEVPQDYSFEYYDGVLGEYVTASDITSVVSNYDYEIKIENAKRNIYVLKPEYLNVVLNDMNDIMPYKKGSTQYVSETLVKGENIRLYS